MITGWLAGVRMLGASQVAPLGPWIPLLQRGHLPATPEADRPEAATRRTDPVHFGHRPMPADGGRPTAGCRHLPASWSWPL